MKQSFTKTDAQELQQEKYRLKTEFEHLVHLHILEEIKVAAAAGVAEPKRSARTNKR